MDKELKEELLYRIKLQPEFIKKISKRYNLDLKFYRTAVSYNIDSYPYIPDEYKDDEVIIDIIISRASNEHLELKYNKIVSNNNEQKEQLKNININICYLYLYKIIYGHDKFFYKEVKLNSMDNDNSVITQINYVLSCLSDFERNLIIYRFGLNDGFFKSIPATARNFKISNLRADNYINNIIFKIRSLIYNSHLSDLGFYDEISDNICKK